MSRRDSGRILLKIAYRKKGDKTDRMLYAIEDGSTYKKLVWGGSETGSLVALAILELNPGEGREIKGNLEELFAVKFGNLNGKFPAPDGKGPQGTGIIKNSVNVIPGGDITMKALYVSKRDSGKVLLKFAYRKKGTKPTGYYTR